MQHDLLVLLDEYNCELQVEDTDSRQDWQKSYGHLLPVLATPLDEVLCHYHLDEVAVREWLGRQNASLCSE